MTRGECVLEKSCHWNKHGKEPGHRLWNSACRLCYDTRSIHQSSYLCRLSLLSTNCCLKFDRQEYSAIRIIELAWGRKLVREFSILRDRKTMWKVWRGRNDFSKFRDISLSRVSKMRKLTVERVSECRNQNHCLLLFPYGLGWEEVPGSRRLHRLTHRQSSVWSILFLLFTFLMFSLPHLTVVWCFSCCDSFWQQTRTTISTKRTRDVFFFSTQDSSFESSLNMFQTTDRTWSQPYVCVLCNSMIYFSFHFLLSSSRTFSSWCLWVIHSLVPKKDCSSSCCICSEDFIMQS